CANAPPAETPTSCAADNSYASRTPAASGESRLIRDRTAGVAMVVPDHEPATLGEQPAETLVTPVHRRAHPHDREDRRISGVAERFRAELDPVCQLPSAMRLGRSAVSPILSSELRASRHGPSI